MTPKSEEHKRSYKAGFDQFADCWKAWKRDWIFCL